MLPPCHFRYLLLAISVCAIAPSNSQEPVRFVAYNLHNYALQPSTEDRASPPKGEREIASMMQILAKAKPDILGVCEMGSKTDLADFQNRLKAAGVDLPNSEWVEGNDKVRHLALLTRFPIASKNSISTLNYQLDEMQFPVQRGLLDVTVQVSETYQLRFVGLHLKSQRETLEAEQNLMRREEAHVVRLRLDAILAETPNVNLLVYGDCNEPKDQPGIREMKGTLGSSNALRDFHLADSAGEKWTYYFEPADEYSRIDYALASIGLMPEIIQKLSGIPTGPEWKLASDHRPLLVVIDPREKERK
jgi:endonuclease/exonuclease/phosphatase family metal-dependent hydrolase